MSTALHSLIAARDAYTAASSKSERERLVEQIRDSSGQLLDEYASGQMPLDVQREIMHAAAVLAPEGHEVQMDVAANAAAGGPLSQQSLSDALKDRSHQVRVEAVRILGEFAKSRRHQRDDV